VLRSSKDDWGDDANDDDNDDHADHNDDDDPESFLGLNPESDAADVADSDIVGFDADSDKFAPVLTNPTKAFVDSDRTDIPAAPATTTAFI